MPTFDFFNVVRQAIKSVLAAVASPVVACTVFATLIGGIVASVTAFFTSSLIPSVDAFVDLPQDDTHLIQFTLYLLDSSTAVDIIDAFLKFVPAFVTFIFSATTTFYIGLWVFRSSLAVRSTVKDQTT